MPKATKDLGADFPGREAWDSGKTADEGGESRSVSVDRLEGVDNRHEPPTKAHNDHPKPGPAA